MRTLFIDCGMGAAGDMLTAALLELVPDRDEFVKELNSLGIPNVEYIAEKSEKCGIKGTHMSVKINGAEEEEHCHNGHSHTHSSLDSIEHIVNEHLDIPQKVKTDIISVYNIIAVAESNVHGVPVNEIHFHEVGTMDAVADVTAVCLLMNKIGADKIMASPVHVGSGQVKCAHGILPVPAPATAEILKDIPIYGGAIDGELCTPTGAALLKYFVEEFGDMPLMKVKSIGYGMGRKDFERANCVRAVLGESDDDTDVIINLACNIDDMTAEAIGFAMDELFRQGAVEVYTTPCGMKKNRLGTVINVMCRQEDRDNIIREIFRHTTTIGIRESINKRYTLSRSIETVSTQYGEIRKKVSEGYGIKKEKFEYDDISKIAKENGMSIEELKEKIK